MGPARRTCLVGLLCLAAAPAWSATRAERSGTRDVQGGDMDELRRYSDRLGREWLRDSLGLDLDALALELDPKNLKFFRPKSSPSGAPPAGPGGPAADGPVQGIRGSLNLKIEQTDDLLRMQRDLRDIPFGLSVKGQLPLSTGLSLLETTLWVPFSWRDEFRAQAEWPLAIGADGFRRLTLRSDYRTQLGLNRWEAGVGTSLRPEGWGVWALDYDFQRNFGQGTEEAVHWLKLSKDF